MRTPTTAPQPAPKNPDDYRLYFDKKFMYAIPAPSEKTPTVLVVGATGETGRQVVEKLILKGESWVADDGRAPLVAPCVEARLARWAVHVAAIMELTLLASHLLFLLNIHRVPRPGAGA